MTAKRPVAMRLPGELWDAAKSIADAQDPPETMTAIVERALAGYIAERTPAKRSRK